MDSVSSLRNQNLPFILDQTPTGPAHGTQSLYYRQLSSLPLQHTSEWNENNPPTHGTMRISGNSPTMIKMAADTTHSIEETPTPSRNPGKSLLETTVLPTPGKNGILVSPSNPAASAISASKPSSSSYTRLSKPTKHISSTDVLWAMLNDLVGKDKMAKLAQYSLRLLLHHARKSQAFLSDDAVNIKIINSTYASNEKVWDLIVDFVKNPRAFAKVLVILTCSVFSSRLAGFVPALGLYRQLLRFGKSPFRIHRLLDKVKQHMYRDPKGNAWRISDKFFSKASLGDCISLYYNFNDDIALLYKVKLLRNPVLKAVASHHGSYAWYCDSWFGLYNAYDNLHKLTLQELDMKISIQVKKRSRTLSKQVLGAHSLQALALPLEDDVRDAQALKDIQFKITNTKLDIYKLISDIIFNSYTVFNAKLHFDTVQIWMGISASFLSSVKLYREKKKALAAR